MSKYDGLETYLRSQKFDEVPMTFADVEKVIGTKLPPSAFEYRPWWSNYEKNSTITKYWLRAGFHSTRVDMTNRKLVFKRVHPNRGAAQKHKPYVRGNAEIKKGPHPLIGAMKGTFTIEPGYDLTQPAMPEWAELIDEKYGKEPSK